MTEYRMEYHKEDDGVLQEQWGGTAETTLLCCHCNIKKNYEHLKFAFSIPISINKKIICVIDFTISQIDNCLVGSWQKILTLTYFYWQFYLNATIQRKIWYYAPPSRRKGPRRCPNRGNAGGALVFLSLSWLLYALGLYTCRKIHLAKLGSSNSTVGGGTCFAH